MDKATRLLIAVPTMGAVHPILVSRLIGWGQKYGEQVSFYFTFKVAPVDRARNQIVEFFLSSERRFTHLLMIDSDTIPPVDAVERLLSHKQPVVTGLTPILAYKDDGYETYDNAFVEVERDGTGKVTKTHVAARNSGLQEVFRCGASCLLIERKVFESMVPPYFVFETNPENTSHVRSEDIQFCDRVRGHGFAIHADTEVVCQHYKDIML